MPCCGRPSTVLMLNQYILCLSSFILWKKCCFYGHTRDIKYLFLINITHSFKDQVNENWWRTYASVNLVANAGSGFSRFWLFVRWIPWRKSQENCDHTLSETMLRKMSYARCGHFFLRKRMVISLVCRKDMRTKWKRYVHVTWTNLERVKPHYWFPNARASITSCKKYVTPVR